MEHRLWKLRTAVFALLVVALALVVACGSAAPAAQQQQQQTGAAPAEQPRAPDLPAVLPTAAVQPAQAAVGAPTVAPQPTAMPAIADPGIRGGHINMVQYADVRQRLAHQSSVLNMNLAPLFNNLIEYNPETPEPGDLRCDLCTSWDLSDDGITYTYNINPDAKWWDGVPVTADDIVFSFESMVSPDQFPAYRGPVHFHPLQHRSVLRFRSG